MFSKKVLEEMEEHKKEWNREYEKYYKGKEYKSCTDSGIEIKPVYTPEDINKSKMEQLAMPGVYPYTREHIR